MGPAGPDREILSDPCFHIYADSNHGLCPEPSMCGLSLHVLLLSSCLASLLLEGITSAQAVPLGAYTSCIPHLNAIEVSSAEAHDQQPEAGHRDHGSQHL